MNPQFLSEAEKRSNAKSRQRRKDRQKGLRRRTLALAALTDPCLVANETAVATHESCGWLWAEDLRNVKRAIRRINATAAASEPKLTPARNSAADGRRVRRPSRVLQKANRGATPRFPTASAAPVLEFLGLERTLARARELAAGGAGEVEILTFMADPMASGLSLSACVAVANASGVLRLPVTTGLQEALERAAKFQSLLSDAQAIYSALVTSGEIAAGAGAWAFFSRPDLYRLLPG